MSKEDITRSLPCFLSMFSFHYLVCHQPCWARCFFWFPAHFQLLTLLILLMRLGEGSPTFSNWSQFSTIQSNQIKSFKSKGHTYRASFDPRCLDLTVGNTWPTSRSMEGPFPATSWSPKHAASDRQGASNGGFSLILWGWMSWQNELIGWWCFFKVDSHQPSVCFYCFCLFVGSYFPFVPVEDTCCKFVIHVLKHVLQNNACYSRIQSWPACQENFSETFRRIPSEDEDPTQRLMPWC